jgi:hypothetical protein
MYCEIKGILVLDSEGSKIYSKYFNVSSDLSSKAGQDLFEKLLKSKISKFSLKNRENEVVLVESWTVVFKMVNSLTLYIIGSNDENEIFMASVLDTLVESLEMVYRAELERSRVVDEMDLLLLTIDEMFEEGLVLAFDASTTTERVLMREANEVAPAKTSVKESLFGRALQNAKQAISKSISARK